MLKFFAACVFMLALAGRGFGQEEAKRPKNPDPIVPQGETTRIAEIVMKDVKNIGLVQTVRGPRVSFELNGDIYHVSELTFKSGGGELAHVVSNGQAVVG